MNEINNNSNSNRPEDEHEIPTPTPTPSESTYRYVPSQQTQEPAQETETPKQAPQEPYTASQQSSQQQNTQSTQSTYRQQNPQQPPYSAYHGNGQQPPVWHTSQQNGSYYYTPPTQGSNVYQNTPPRRAKRAKKAKKTGWTPARITALALCCALVGGLFGFGGSALGNKLWSKEEKGQPAFAENSAVEPSTVLQGERDSVILDTENIDTSKKLSAAEVYAANVNSTVGITTSITTNYWGYQTTSAASGSGFILTSDGYILTNYHVIEDSDSITVTTYSDESYAAELIGYDESNDIAVLKVEAENLVPVVIGDSDALYVGDDVVAIGNPLGELTFSLTAGAVSALDREVTLSTGVTMDLIQTDCAINSGNSGGALFNMYGEVIGITNAKYSSSSSSSTASIDNIGFAIPINSVYDIVTDIIEKGYISKPYIGVYVSDVSEEAQSYGLPKGAAVSSFTEDSPAEKAGLKANDIITAVNGTEITSKSELTDIVSAASPNDVLTLTVYRQGETLEIQVTVGEKIQSAKEAEEEAAAAEGQQQQQGSYDQYGQYGQGGQSQQDGSQSYTFPWGYFFGN